MTVKGSKKNIEAVYPLSPMQEGMLFHSLLNPDEGYYFERFSCTFHGKLDTKAFVDAWKELINRHSILRTSYVWKRLDNMLQVVHRNVNIPFEQLNWRGLTKSEQEEKLSEYLDSEKRIGFDLSKAPLIRLALMRIAEDASYFVWSYHHSLLDGWSQPILIQEFNTIYEGLSGDSEFYLQPAKPFREYIDWIKNQDIAQAENFWRTKLQGFTTPTPLEIDLKPNNIESGSENIEIGITIPKSTSEKIVALAGEHHVTINTFVLGAWAILLSRYIGKKDVLFGVTVSGRSPELEGSNKMVGLFINTLPMRVQIPTEVSIKVWLKNLQTQQLEMRQYEHSPLVKIQEWSDFPGGTSLFENIFVFENYPVSSLESNSNRSLVISDVLVSEKANYPLTLVAAMSDDLSIKFAFDNRKFDGLTIQRILDHLETILNNMAISLDDPIDSLVMLPEKEKYRLLQEWNDTSTLIPEDQCIHQLFEDQAVETPDAVALMTDGEEITFSELNQRANRLANYLRSIGVGPETLVGILLDRSTSFITGIIGVLKAGGAYVPLDVGYPKKRIDYMLTNADVKVVISADRFSNLFSDYTEPIVLLDNQHVRNEINKFPLNKPQLNTSTEQPAYIIYTSGSTGEPKGVVLGHRGLVNLVLAQIEKFNILPGDKLLQFASVSFDASVSEIFTSLVSGATLYLVDQGSLSSPDLLIKLIRDRKISVVTLPPSLLQVMPSTDLPELKTLISAGEICPWDIAQKWSSVPRLINAYGPTEATIGPTCYLVDPENLDKHYESKSVPIGRPIWNTQIYILDKSLHPVPVGLTGDLYIAGVGLAHGYLNQPKLTEKKFIQHELDDVGSVRLYRTGDLARYLTDGNIEFVGRVDDQVSIRGFRIELGEIESALNQHPSVKNAVILTQKNDEGDRRLIAYLISESGFDLNIAELRDYLYSKLPRYMVPNLYAVLDEFPLTTSGKINRKALLEVDGIQTGFEENYVPPQTPHQELLAGIFSQILGVESVGINDNFFELGGHSLLVTKLVSKIRKTFQVEIDLREVFEAPTLMALARIIQEGNQEERAVPPPIIPVEKDGLLPLSFAQQRLWFLDQLLPGNSFYNIPLTLRLDGVLNIHALESALNGIIERHDVLRTTFSLIDGKPVQNILPELVISIPVIDLSKESKDVEKHDIEEMAINEARKSFDLSKGPLLRAQVIKLTDTNHVILFTLHHIVADGWSMQILVREMAAQYKAYLTNKPSLLSPLPIQYADFTIWQREWLQGQNLENQKEYWRSQLKGSQTILDLPTDRPRPAIPSSNGAHLDFSLPSDLSLSIVELSHQEGATIFMLLLSAFITLLYRYTGQTDINVGTPIANRTRDEIEGLIGFFVNTLIMRGDLSGNPTFRDFLKRIRDMAFDAYSNQDFPFESLVEMLQPVRDMSHSPLFQVMFTLDNNSSEILELPDLKLSPFISESGTSKFDLTLQIQDRTEFLVGNIEYNSDLFDKSTIERFASQFKNLLVSIVNNPNQKISELSIIGTSELREMLVEWNNTQAPIGSDICVHQLFEQWVQHSPDSVAVSYGEDTLTYLELDKRANQFGHYLQSIGVGPEIFVGVCLDRSIDLVISLLGIWKAGGVFVPLDPEYPKGRLSYLVTDANVSVLLTQEDHVGLLSHLEIPISILDKSREQIRGLSVEKPNNSVLPENLAYVIYTSGSTGRPKGVQLPHIGLCNVVATQVETFKVGPGDRVLQFSSLSFDAAMFEMVMGICSGGTLCMGSREEMRPGRDLLDFLLKVEPTIVVFPPSALKVMPDSELPSVRIITVAGEACPAELVSRWANGRQFYNLYGPIEGTIGGTSALCDSGDEKPPVGKPIQNHQGYIVDDYDNPVPIGVSGELVLGGVGVARGYLGRPGLTADKFIPNQFGNGERLYKSGDIARYLPDGNIDFIGREDDQVKVRGYRIELGEIEVALNQNEDIKETAVLIHTDDIGVPKIIAYIVPQNDQVPEPHFLKKYLGEHLPKFMIPTVFIYIEKLPLLPSGKVNRKELPSPDSGQSVVESKYIQPRNQLEQTLVQMWQKIIRIDKIGVHDNFFELGGDSIRGAVFINQLEKIIGESIYVAALFEAQTIAELAGYLLDTYPDVVKNNFGEEPLSDSELELLISTDRSGSNDKSVHPAIVPIQEKGAKTPLFCLHAAGGVVFPYYNLVPYLGSDQPLYGIQRPTNAKLDKKFLSLENLASYYIEGLQLVQPNGPYYLAGWSSGGVVAFEMAQQLRNLGETVSFLGIIDFKAPIGIDEIRRRRRIYGKFKFGRFRLISRFLRTLPHFIKEFFVLLKSALSFTKDGLYLKLSNPKVSGVEPSSSQEKPTFKEYIKWVWISAMRRNVLGGSEISNVVSRNTDLMLIELPTVRHTIGRVGKDINLAKKYVAKEYNGNITLFDAGSLDDVGGELSDPTMGWDELTTGEINIRKITGNHIAVLTQPYVGPFAEILKECLEEASKAN